MPAKLDLVAARNVPWAPTIDLRYTGGALPMNDATVSMQVRLYPGADGNPLISLTNIPFDDIASPTNAQPSRRILRLFPVAPEASFDGVPSGLNEPDPGEADRFSYDIVITYSNGTADRPAAGYFFLEPGVTE